MVDRVGEDFFKRQQISRHVCMPVGDSGYFLAFNWRNIRNLKEHEQRITLYCDNQDLLFMGDCAAGAQILRGFDPDTKPFVALADFFFELTDNDIDVMEGIEREINEMEVDLLTENKPGKGALKNIVSLRRDLMKLKRYYEQLGIVVDRLVENDNQSIAESIHNRYRTLDKYIQYLLHFVLELREFLTQVREAYQSQIDIEQNQIMKIFTVITAIFLPLTLIVGWYGMNFRIPELDWTYGYLYVIGLSVVVCLITYQIIKRNHWF